jgi:hypothetical protein
MYVTYTFDVISSIYFYLAASCVLVGGALPYLVPSFL